MSNSISTNVIGGHSYFLEIGLSNQSVSRSLAKGICIQENESTAEKTNNIWGQLSFYDQIANRHRIISIKDKPSFNNYTIKCLSDINEEFHFTLVTKKVWDDEVAAFIKLPADFQKILQEHVKTTEQIQNFLINYF